METVISKESVAVLSPGSAYGVYADEVPEKQRIKQTKLPMITGKLEVTIKINKLPNDIQTNKYNCKNI